MVNKSSIFSNLELIEKLYNTSSSTEALLYSKLAIIELCGWIEESMDDIVKEYANIKLNNIDNINFLDDEIIGKNYGFEYDKHFRKMLMQVIGIVGLETLEKNVNKNKLQRMKSSLGTLKGPRNTESHTYIKGTTRTIDAPSVTKRKLMDVYEGLKNFEAELKKL